MTTTEGQDMTGEHTPLTHADLVDIDRRWGRYQSFRSATAAEASVSDIPVLLAEVDRLRAQVVQYHKSADEHVAKFDRKHAALMDARAESARLRAELDDAKRLADYYHEDRDATAGFWEDSQLEVNRLEAELKAAKSTRFENNGVGVVAKHIQAETINDLRLN
jgi:uncharacterized small protein (DUF1192 family)